MEEYFKENRGITLIALIITIIILLILAGITIASLTNSGLFSKTQQAKQETENAQAEENAILSEYEQWLANYIGDGITSDGTETEQGTLASTVHQEIMYNTHQIQQVQLKYWVNLQHIQEVQIIHQVH